MHFDKVSGHRLWQREILRGGDKDEPVPKNRESMPGAPGCPVVLPSRGSTCNVDSHKFVFVY